MTSCTRIYTPHLPTPEINLPTPEINLPSPEINLPQSGLHLHPPRKRGSIGPYITTDAIFGTQVKIPKGYLKYFAVTYTCLCKNNTNLGFNITV